MPLEPFIDDERPLHNLAVSSYTSSRSRREDFIKRRKVDARKSSLSSSIPDHTTVFSISSASADRSQGQGTQPLLVTTTALAQGEISNSSPTAETTPSPSHPPTMQTRTLVPIVVCVVLVGVVGAVLATWHARRRRRQRRRRIELRLGQSERAVANDDDEPAIWDNRPPAATPIPPPRSAYAYGIDTSEYSPTATVFSPTTLAFPPAALEKPSDLASKVYEPYSYILPGPESRSPPRSPPRIVIDQWDLDDARMSLYSVDSFYPPASPVPSSEPGIGMRAISPTVLDTFPSPPPLAHSFNRSISIPDLRSPAADASARGANNLLASEDLDTVPALPMSRRVAHRPSESPQLAPRHVVVASPSFGPFSGTNSSYVQPRYGSPRKKRSLQTSRNSLDIIRERGAL